MEQLTLLSLFDGSGGFALGAKLVGIEPIAASEIEPLPIRVTTKRLPEMRHLGDIAKIDGGRIEPVDIITFGSPCTDLSVAGKQAGIDGKQSALFFEAIRIIKEMRYATNGEYPRYGVWENVPGVFSSNKGADFKAVLDAFVQVTEPETEVPAPDQNRWPYADILVGDGWSVAYRTIDAQYFGVPQRRRRIYLVADFGSERAGEVLFEPEGVSRDFAPCRSSWQRTAGGLAAGSGSPVSVLNDQGGSFMDVTENITGTLRSQEHGHQPIVFEPGAASRVGGHCWQGEPTGALRADMGDNQLAVAIENHPADSRIKIDESGTVQTLTERMGTGGGNVPLVLQGHRGNLPKAYGICSKNSNSMMSANPHSGIYEATTSRTIDANGGNPGCNQGGIAVVAVENYQHGGYRENEVAGMLRHSGGTNGGGSESLIIENRYSVRRLTPTECARLQGFPDWWCSDLGTAEPTEEGTAFWAEVWETHRCIAGTSSKPKTRKQIIKWLRSPHSDSAEYKMWGNGVALPCVIFVLSGIISHGKEV